MKRNIGILICVFLLLFMTISAVTAQKVIKDNHKNVNVLENSPPSNPIVTGPRFVLWFFKVFNIEAVSTDPDGDNIRYRIKIGDDDPLAWTPLYNSGKEIKFEVKLLGSGYSGKLIISVQAKDDPYGAESGWTNHTVTIIKTRSMNSPNYFNRLFPRLFNLFGAIIPLFLFYKRIK